MKKVALLSLLLLFSFSAISILEAASAQPKRGGTITLGISKELALMNPLVNTSSTESRIRELMYEPLLARDSKGAIQHSQFSRVWWREFLTTVCGLKLREWRIPRFLE